MILDCESSVASEDDLDRYGTPRWRGTDFQSLLETSIRVHLRRRKSDSRKSVEPPTSGQAAEDAQSAYERKLKAARNQWRMHVAAAKQELADVQNSRRILEKQVAEAKAVCREAVVEQQHATEGLEMAKRRITTADAVANALAEQAKSEQAELVSVVRTKEQLLSDLSHLEEHGDNDSLGAVRFRVDSEGDSTTTSSQVAEKRSQIESMIVSDAEGQAQLVQSRKEKIRQGHALAAMEVEWPVVTRQLSMTKRRQLASAAVLERSTRDRKELATRVRVAHTEEERLRDAEIQAAAQRRLELKERRRELLALQAEEPDLRNDLNWAEDRREEASRQSSVLQEWRANSTKAHLATCGELQRKLQRTWLASSSASTTVAQARNVVEHAVRQRPGGDCRPSSAFSLLSVAAGFPGQSRPPSGHVHNGLPGLASEEPKVSCEATRLEKGVGAARLASPGRMTPESAAPTVRASSASTLRTAGTRPSSAVTWTRPSSTTSMGRVSTMSTAASRSATRPLRPGSVPPGKQKGPLLKSRGRLRPASSDGRLPTAARVSVG